MVCVKISKELITDMYTQGTINKFKVSQGLPVNCELEVVRFDGSILYLYFSERREEVKDLSITCERIK